MNWVKNISTGLFYCVWGVMAFAMLLTVMVLAVMVDIACVVSRFIQKLFKTKI